MKKVVLFGSIGIAKKCLQNILNKENDIVIIGVCCQKDIPEWRNEDTVYKYCIENNIKIIEDMNEILQMKPDLGFSIRYNKIIPENIIEKFKIGIFNTHGGILPDYRGTYSNMNCLINHEKEYGVTLHKIDKGIDTGDIVDILKIKINDDDTGYDLYRKGEELCYKILEKNIEKLVKNEFELIKQDDLIKRGYKTNTYSINGTLKQKEINIEELNNISVYDKIRAFDSPYHEPAYIIINGKKVYLTTKLWKEIK